MNLRIASSRRGLTLIEAVAAVVVLGIAVPPTLSMLADASANRADSIAISRATLYAQAVMEQVVADVSSQEPALGFSALSDSSTYVSSLEARLESVSEAYSPYGMTWTLAIGDLSDAEGTTTGDVAIDRFRRVVVAVEFMVSDGVESLRLDHMLTGGAP